MMWDDPETEKNDDFFVVWCRPVVATAVSTSQVFFLVSNIKNILFFFFRKKKNCMSASSGFLIISLLILQHYI